MSANNKQGKTKRQDLIKNFIKLFQKQFNNEVSPIKDAKMKMVVWNMPFYVIHSIYHYICLSMKKSGFHPKSVQRLINTTILHVIVCII